MTEQRLPAWADPSVSPAALDAQGLSRRHLMRRAGLFGAAFTLGSAATPAPAAADGGRPGGVHGPVPHAPGDGDPWADTWFYSNPVFVDVEGS